MVAEEICQSTNGVPSKQSLCLEEWINLEHIWGWKPFLNYRLWTHILSMHLPGELGSFVPCTPQYSVSFHKQSINAYWVPLYASPWWGNVDPKMNKGSPSPWVVQVSWGLRYARATVTQYSNCLTEYEFIQRASQLHRGAGNVLKERKHLNWALKHE